LLGWALLLGVLMLSALGASGLARVLANCVQRNEPKMSDFRALLRGAGLLIAAALVPLLGWFFVVPLTIIMSTGAGWYALRGRVPAKRQKVLQEAPQITSTFPQTLPTSDVLMTPAPVSHHSAEAVL
jgi:hypothetical protein